MKKDNINKSDIVFLYLTHNDPLYKSQLSYYGWEGSIEHFFFNYIEGYKYAANAVYGSFKLAAREHRIEIQDTIVYPLVFLYRHITELYLKYIYILLCKPTNEELKSFLKKGHKLPDLWNGLKERVSFLFDRIAYDIDLDAIEKYVSELDKNDKESFCYRYPITPKGLPLHKSFKYLDIDNLKKRMDAFFEYLDLSIGQIDNQWNDDEYNENFNLCFNKEFKSSHKKIKELFSYLQRKKIIDKEENTKIWLSFSDIHEPKEEIEYEYQFISELTENQKSLFIILYWAGSMLPMQHLAASKEERTRDIYKVLYNSSNSDVTFNNQSSLYKNNVLHTCLFGSTKTMEYMQNVINELGVFL